MNLITTDELSEYMASAIIEGDVADQIITHVSRRAAIYCDRDDWGGSSERTEYLDGGTRFLMVRYWPISSVASIYDDPEHEWAASSLLDSTEYWIAQNPEANGIIYLDYKPTESPWSIKVTYTGGYDAVGSIPGDLKTAALIQCKHEAMQMRAAMANEISREWLPEVAEVLRVYKRSRVFA